MAAARTSPTSGDAEASPGSLCELARYTVDEGERVLVGRRVDGVVHVLDWPLRGGGRRYHVESGFESKAELAVLVAEYRRFAERLGACPMSRASIERALEAPCAGPPPPQAGTP
jgi:hypothetical protein